MGIKDRIKRLEQNSSGAKDKSLWLVIAIGGLNQEDADAKVEAAKSEYRAKHPNCADSEIYAIIVKDEAEAEEIRQLISSIPERIERIGR